MQPRIIRFGPFELDVRAAELRKHGTKARLHEQPFRILLMLLEHPGDVVLRDGIRQALWPNNTVAEFDHSINAAILRLRDALGDSADRPRYVETVARRGYRFIGIVGFNLNTVHLMILIAFRRLIGSSGSACGGRRGKLLILRFTPRKFRRLRLETTRSCRISSRTAL